MDILISLLYTGAQDGWMTINGRARLFPQNKERRSAARGATMEGRGATLSLCFEDDTSHLGLDVPANTWRQSIHPEVTKVLLTQQLSSRLQGPTTGSAVTSMTALDTLTSPHFHTTCFSLSVIAITFVIIP